MTSPPLLSVVIPSYRRGQLLLATLDLLFSQSTPVKQIVVVDQTDYPDADPVKSVLQKLHNAAQITWLRLTEPSIPHAMNVGLLEANSEYVLFLDDDVEFNEGFIDAHLKALQQNSPLAQVGQIIQPWQRPISRSAYQPGSGLSRDLQFPFNSDAPAEIANCMAGNLVVRRTSAIAAGGFDENFSGAAYRFETEFCRRLIACSGQLFHFVPSASLDHLHHATGGTRAQHNHLTSASPRHSVGDYYFALLHGRGLESLRYTVTRLLSSPLAKFYLTKPWYLPFRLIGEIRGLVAAIGMLRRGAKLILDGQHTA